MSNVTIRNLPDDVHKVLKSEAAASRRSLSSVMIQALREHAEALNRRRELATLIPEMDALRERIRSRGGLTSDSAELLREDRSR